MDDKQRNKVLLLLFVGVLVAALDIAIVGPALPAIQAEYAADTRAMVLKIARQTAEQIGAPAIEPDDVVLDEAYAYPRYGIPSAETLAAIRLGATLEGLVTDPVYEGKSLQALIDKVRAGVFEPGSRVLYVHLGGVPALSAYAALFR